MKLARRYIKTYSGLSAEVWMLSLIMLINRSGSVVLPFLSIYLSNELGFTLEETGIVLTAYGFGSLSGSWFGGWLTDKVDSFTIQASSLLLSGVGFLILRELQSFEFLVIGFYLVTLITDSLRPANGTAIAQYSKKENFTKAYSLNRMAVNLGFSVGPALGGFLAAKSFGLLFLADGLTCFFAAALFIFYFRKRKELRRDDSIDFAAIDEIVKKPYEDIQFVLFCICTFGFAVVFFQLLNTLPLYYSISYELDERIIGYLLALNGLLVFLLEMPIVDTLSKKASLKNVVMVGTILAGLAFLIFNFQEGIIILLLNMFLLSISEILVMPFLTTYTANRGRNKSRGKYLGFYGMAYSLALIVAPALGTFLIDTQGFRFLWYSMFVISIAAVIGFSFVIKKNAA